MKFIKGISGNPAGGSGRKKTFSLVESLINEFSEKDLDGKSSSQIIARMIKELIVFGKTTLEKDSSGEVKSLTLSPQDWVDLVKWSYNRIDGVPTQEIKQEVDSHIVFDVPSTMGEEGLPAETVDVITDADGNTTTVMQNDIKFVPLPSTEYGNTEDKPDEVVGAD